MPRRENPIVTEVECVAELAQGLRSLRRSQRLTLEELSHRAHYSISALSEATSGRKLPSRELTLAFVRACDGDVQEWKARWLTTATTLSANANAARAANVVAGDSTSRDREDNQTAGAGDGSDDEVEILLAAVNEDTPHRTLASSHKRSAAVVVTAAVIAVVLFLSLNRLSGATTAPAGYVPVPGPSASALWTVPEYTDNHGGVPVFTDTGANNIGTIPFAVMVQVVCFVPNTTDMTSVNAFYLLGGPPQWRGTYAPANAFTNGDPLGAPVSNPHDIDPNVPRCADGGNGGREGQPRLTTSPS